MLRWRSNPFRGGRPVVTTQPELSSSDRIKKLIGGQWGASRSSRSGSVYNPSNGGVIATVPFCTASEVDRAVRAAATSLPYWAETPVVERARVMFRFRDLLTANAEELANLVTREHGKTLAE